MGLGAEKTALSLSVYREMNKRQNAVCFSCTERRWGVRWKSGRGACLIVCVRLCGVGGSFSVEYSI